jgi:purine-binding chemotaxis protein CheW
MDLLKAREKAKRKVLDEKKQTPETVEKSEMKTEDKQVSNLEIPAKKDAQKIEEAEAVKKEEITTSKPPIAIEAAAGLKPVNEASPLSNELKELLAKIFEDSVEAPKPQEALPSALPKEEFTQYLIFRIGNELYGIDLDLVSEIIRYRKGAFIPNTPDYVHGLITLRGHMVPIINSNLRLNLAPTPATNKSRIVIVEIDKEYMGFTVDEASNVISIENSLIKPPPPTLTDIELELIKGVYEYKNSLIIILNKDTFFKFL